MLKFKKNRVGIMINIKSEKMTPIIRYFNKVVEWLGLSRNSGSILALLYLARYDIGAKLSLDEISKATQYSRSNVTLILTQLESLGLLDGETDITQAGRGRRRTLYSIADDVSSPISILVKQAHHRLLVNLQEIKSLSSSLGSENNPLTLMLEDFENETKEALKSFK